jgi:hypothetical protein
MDNTKMRKPASFSISIILLIRIGFGISCEGSAKFSKAGFDTTKTHFIPLIDQLEVNESYTVFVKSSGCFNYSLDSFEIKRLKDHYTITLDTRQKTLTAGDIDSIRKFERELLTVNERGCTTTETYYVYFRNQHWSYRDGSCAWWGFSNLSRLLFEGE